MTTNPWLQQAEQVVSDVEQPTPEPVLIGHVIALCVSLAAGAGVSASWALDPGLPALVVSLLGAVASVTGHSVTWWITRGKVIAIRPSTQTPPAQ